MAMAKVQERGMVAAKKSKQKPLTPEQQLARWMHVAFWPMDEKSRQYQQDFAAMERARRASLFDKENKRVREMRPAYIENPHSGKLEQGQVVKDGLWRMRESGNISETAYKAARQFEYEFIRCGYGGIKTTNLTGAGGGGMAIEDVMARYKRSRDYVYHVLDMLCGDGSPMAAAVCYYVGQGKTFKEIVKLKGESTDYWRSAFHCAVRIMEDDYKRMNAGKRRRTRFSGFTT